MHIAKKKERDLDILHVYVYVCSSVPETYSWRSEILDDPLGNLAICFVLINEHHREHTIRKVSLNPQSGVLQCQTHLPVRIPCH